MIWKPSFDDLQGARVLVTGASSGIGAAVAVGFGACGAHVVVHYRSNENGAQRVVAKFEAAGARAISLQADLSDPGAHADLAGRAVEALGGLDILVNNAGGVVERRGLADADDLFYQRLFDLNVRSVVGLTRACLPALQAGQNPAVVTTGSISVRTGGKGGTVLYAATKGALHSLTIGLARELGPLGIRVNAVAPGLIVTPLHELNTSSEALERFRVEVPLGRLGSPEDCVGAFLFLASSRLAGYITGAVLEVSGGR